MQLCSGNRQLIAIQAKAPSNRQKCMFLAISVQNDLKTASLLAVHFIKSCIFFAALRRPHFFPLTAKG